MELVRKQTYITPEQDRELKELARRYGTTEADILRRALDSWIALEARNDGEDVFAGLIGIAEGPRESDHDDIYS